MNKSFLPTTYKNSLSGNLTISPMSMADVAEIVTSFEQHGWVKSLSVLEVYINEQANHERIAWIAAIDNKIAGYVTLKWKSAYKLFANHGIPEIMDLNVLPPYRRCGIGSELLDYAEEEAADKSDLVGIGAGLYGGTDGGYGAAQKLYVKRGYLPDGHGITYAYQPVIFGSKTILDDNLVLWFIKKLK